MKCVFMSFMHFSNWIFILLLCLRVLYAFYLYKSFYGCVIHKYFLPKFSFYPLSRAFCITNVLHFENVQFFHFFLLKPSQKSTGHHSPVDTEGMPQCQNHTSVKLFHNCNRARNSNPSLIDMLLGTDRVPSTALCTQDLAAIKTVRIPTTYIQMDGHRQWM